VLEMRSGYVKLLMPLEGNVNHIGTIYAGPLFILGEVVGGAIFFAAFDYEKYYPIVKEINIKFKKPGTTDITVETQMSPEQIAEIETKAAKEGKADFTLDLELKDSNEKIVSVISGVWQIRSIAKPI
jgi:uncharacterized protein DUF4442